MAGSNVTDVLLEQRQESEQEAINASLQPSKSSSSPSSSWQKNGDKFERPYGGEGSRTLTMAGSNVNDVLLEQRQESEQEAINASLQPSKSSSSPSSSWQKNGDKFERPYGGEGSRSTAVPEENFRVYVTGLVSEERVMRLNVTVAAIGVAVCDSNDLLLYELRKPLFEEENKSVVNFVDVGIIALIEGLNTAISLDLKSITCFCDEYLVNQYLTGRLPPPPMGKTKKLITEFKLLQTKFVNLTLSLVARTDIKFAVKLAEEAIVSQLTTRSGMDHVMNMMDTCVICFEDTAVYKMFAVDGCLHRFCLPCMKQHVEVKLLNGMMAKCPHIGCNSEVNIDKCEAFLEPKLIEKIRQCKKEASIPVTERVYSPNLSREDTEKAQQAMSSLSPDALDKMGVVGGDGCDSDMFSIDITEGFPASSLETEMRVEDAFAFIFSTMTILFGLFLNIFNAIVAQIGIRFDNHKVGLVMTILSLLSYVFTIFQFGLYTFHIVADFAASKRTFRRDFLWLLSFGLLAVIVLIIFGIIVPHVGVANLIASALSIFMGLSECYFFIRDL